MQIWERVTHGEKKGGSVLACQKREWFKSCSCVESDYIKDFLCYANINLSSTIHHIIAVTSPLADSKGKVVGIRASLGATIDRGNSRAVRLISSKANTLSIEGVAINVVERVVDNTSAVRGTPDQLGGVGRVVVGTLGQAVAVALALELLAVVATIGGQLLLGVGLVLTGDGEVDVLRAVVLDCGLASKSGGGESEDAGGGESAEVHFGCVGCLKCCLRSRTEERLEWLSWFGSLGR